MLINKNVRPTLEQLAVYVQDDGKVCRYPNARSDCSPSLAAG